MPEHYIGLMSGTSADSIDAALVSIGDDGDLDLLAWHEHPYPDDIKAAVRALAVSGADEIKRVMAVDQALGAQFAAAALAVVTQAELKPHQIEAIGSHGQTVRHQPNQAPRFSLQVGSPAMIAECTGITTVADFRTRDMAAGGQGAPLVPAFHETVFRHDGRNRAIVNVGGIANVTWLPGVPQQPTLGFDTGPGNTLLDAWCRRHTGQHYDHGGAWAASGEVLPALLATLLADAYFGSAAPKSTGFEYFNLAWLENALTAVTPAPAPQDVQATLAALTTTSIAQSLQALGQVDEIYVCGGGAHNPVLMTGLRAALAPVSVATTQDLGVPPDAVEACAFAWLAFRTLHRLPGNLPSVTGAAQAVILGAIWPGGTAPVMDVEDFSDGG